MDKIKVGFLGCGNMGGSIARRICIGDRYSVFVYDKDTEKARAFAETYGAGVMDADGICRECRFVFLAVKPQIMPGLLRDTGPLLDSRSGDCCVVSMAAGWSIEKISEYLKTDFPVIRIMPNTPVAVGEGMVVYSYNSGAEVYAPEFVGMMGACGLIEHVDESKIDAVTSISGCGPAYVYMFANAMADAGVSLGLTRSLAQELASQTLLGAAKMMQSSDKHPMTLKDEVCSPGGSTIQGVLALEKEGFCHSVEKAVTAGFEKTRELGK